MKLISKKCNLILQSDTVHLQWAIEEKDPISESDTTEKISRLFSNENKNWLGTRSIHLTTKSATDHPEKKNMRYWDITLDNVRYYENSII